MRSLLPGSQQQPPSFTSSSSAYNSCVHSRTDTRNKRQLLRLHPSRGTEWRQRPDVVHGIQQRTSPNSSPAILPLLRPSLGLPHHSHHQMAYTLQMTITTVDEATIAGALLKGGTGWIASMDHEASTPSLAGCFQWVDGPECGETVYNVGSSTSCASSAVALALLNITVSQSYTSSQSVFMCSMLAASNALMSLDCVTGRAAGYLVEYEPSDGECRSVFMCFSFIPLSYSAICIGALVQRVQRLWQRIRSINSPIHVMAQCPALCLICLA